MADSTAKKIASPSDRTPSTLRPAETSTRPKAPRTRAATATPTPGPKVDEAAAWAAAPSALDTVHIHKGGIERADANEINVKMGGIGRADATDIAVSIGGVGLARAERVSVEMGGIGLAVAGEARLSQGFARYVVAREASVEQGLIGTMITGRATIQRTSGVFLLVAGRVDGPVKAVLDWRGGLAFGAAFGLFWALLRRR